MQERIEGFLWLDWVIDKIVSAHGVQPSEAEEVFFNVPNQIRKTSTGKYLLYGQSNAGRYLFVVSVWIGRQIKVISARDMTRSERSQFRRK
jgi:hypothetical protein